MWVAGIVGGAICRLEEGTGCHARFCFFVCFFFNLSFVLFFLTGFFSVIALAILELTEIHLCLPRVLGLKAWASIHARLLVAELGFFFFFFIVFIYLLCVCLLLAGAVVAFFLPLGSQRLNSNCQTWQQATLPCLSNLVFVLDKLSLCTQICLRFVLLPQPSRVLQI